VRAQVCELAAAGKPAIFIPYPYHKDNQQLLNASWLQDSNGAEVIEQKDLSLARGNENYGTIRKRPWFVECHEQKRPRSRNSRCKFAHCFNLSGGNA
jgi:hypothetical protein